MAPSKINLIDTPEAFAAAFDVSRETLERLMAYKVLLKRWQRTINLVAPSTLAHVWHRHFADSAQVWALGRKTPSPRQDGERVEVRGGNTLEHAAAPHPDPLPIPSAGGWSEGKRRHWLDLGSGAGFPGLVIAILAAESGGTRHTLIESDSRKAAFMREVARETGVAVDILCARIENPETRARVGEVHCVTARAVAPLPRLAALARPYFGSTTVGIFLKGREVAAEIEETALSWDIDFELFPSLTDAQARVLLLKSLKPKA